MISARVLMLVFAFSAGTNDTAGLRPQQLLVISFAVVGALGFLGMAAGAIFAPDPTMAAVFCLLTGVEAYGFFRVYGWFYSRMFFDLMSIPR